MHWFFLHRLVGRQFPHSTSHLELFSLVGTSFLASPIFKHILNLQGLDLWELSVQTIDFGNLEMSPNDEESERGKHSLQYLLREEGIYCWVRW